MSPSLWYIMYMFKALSLSWIAIECDLETNNGNKKGHPPKEKERIALINPSVYAMD